MKSFTKRIDSNDLKLTVPDGSKDSGYAKGTSDEIRLNTPNNDGVKILCVNRRGIEK